MKSAVLPNNTAGAMHTPLEYDATAHSVEAVTVFRSNQAEVKRTIKVELTNGQNNVLVKDLPACLSKDSLRVDDPPEMVKWDPEPAKDIQGIQDEKARLEAELAILNTHYEALSLHCKTLSDKVTDSVVLIGYLDKLAFRQRQIYQSAAELHKQIKEIDKQILGASAVRWPDRKDVAQRGVRVTIVVMAEGDGVADLSLSYVVSNASWQPLYDLRAAIAPDPKSQSTVHLHYRASITQSTGEDWSNVVLMLSTASPLRGTKIPTLLPHWIDKHEPPAPDSVLPAAPRTQQSSLFQTNSVTVASTSVSASGSGLFGQFQSLPKVIRGLDSTASQGAVSAMFSIAGQSTIPSDSDGNAQTHKVSIAEIHFESVELEWITVPKSITDVFLSCKVQNASNYHLLPGPTNVFLNNSFVAKSSIPHVSPQESFSCSLGVDPSVRVTYYPQSEKVNVTAGFSVNAKTAAVFHQRMSIKNTRLFPIQKLIVKDQVPVSRDSSIYVNLLEPKELNGKTGAALIPLKKGLQVHWAGQDEPSLFGGYLRGRAEEDLGFVEWICELGASETLDLDLAWEVTSPANEQWKRVQ